MGGHLLILHCVGRGGHTHQPALDVIQLLKLHPMFTPAQRSQLFYNAIPTYFSHPKESNTAFPILATLEYKLSLALQVPYQCYYCIANQSSPNQHPFLLQAIKHQNILGWDNFLQGCISIFGLILINLSLIHPINQLHPLRPGKLTLLEPLFYLPPPYGRTEIVFCMGTLYGKQMNYYVHI
jgi:hypothetical protein